MPTLIASIAALTVAFVGAMSAIWAIVRDRERLRALERVSGLLKDFEHDTVEWEMIRSMQRDLTREVFHGHLLRLMGARWMRWARNIGVAALLPLVAAIPLGRGLLGTVAEIIGVVLFVIGFVLYFKANAVHRNGLRRTDLDNERLASQPSDEAK